MGEVIDIWFDEVAMPEWQLHNIELIRSGDYNNVLVIRVDLKRGDKIRANTVKLNKPATMPEVSEALRVLAEWLTQDHYKEEVEPYQVRCPECRFELGVLAKHAKRDVPLDEFIARYFKRHRNHEHSTLCPQCGYKEDDFIENQVLKTLVRQAKSKES